MTSPPPVVAAVAPRTPPRPPLRRRLRRFSASLATRTLVVFAVVALTLLGITAHQASSGLDVAEERASERAQVTGRAAAGAVLDEVVRVQGAAATLERLPGFWSGSDEDRDALLDAFVDPMPAFQSLGFADASLQQRGVSTHAREDAREALAADRLSVAAEPLRSLVTGELILPIAVPIRDRTGGSAARGLLIGSLGLDRLPRLWDDLGLPPGSATFLVDTRAGRILAGSGWAAGRIGDQIGPGELDRLRAGAMPGRVSRPGAGDRLRAAAPIEPTSWVVVVDLPLGAVLDPIRAAALHDAAIGLLISVAALLLLILLWRQLSRRLRALSTAIGRWTAGDRAYRARIGGADEIAELGGAFDLMAGRLEDAVKRLEAAAIRSRAGEAHTRAILDNILDAVITIDDHGTIDSFNRAAERIFGSPAAEIVGRNVTALMPATLIPAHVAGFDRYQRTGRATLIGRTVEVPARRRDGTTFPLDLAVSELQTEPGRLFIGIGRDITERRRAEQALAERTSRLEAVRAVTEEITRELDLTTLLDLIIRRAADLIGVSSGMIQIWDEAEQALVPRAWQGFGDWLGDLRIPLGQGIGGTVAARREGLIVNDYPSSPYLLPEMRDRTRVSAVLAEPLIYRDRLLGVIGLDDEQSAHAFTEQDREILRPFADQAAIAIANAQLYHDLEDRLARFQTVTRLNQVIATSLDMDEVLWEIARAASQLLDARVASFWIADEAQATLDPRVSVAEAASVAFPLSSLAYGEGAAGWVAEHRRPLLIPDIFVDDRVLGREWWRSKGLRSLYALPIVLEGKLLAVLTLSRERPFRASAGDREMLDSLITQAAVAIRNAGLYAALTAANADLERAVRRTKLILNSVGEGILGVDVDGYTTFANPAVERLTGFRPDEIVGRRAHDVLHHSRPDGTPLPIEACRTHQEREAEAEDFVTLTTFWRKDGTSFAAEVANSAIRDGEVTVGGVITFRDVTERQTVERLKDEFISVVSHELKTPLTSIRGSLGLLGAGVLGPLPETGRRMVEIAVANTDRLVRLINDILDVERMEAGQASFEKRACELGDLLERAGETMTAVAVAAGVTLEVERTEARLWADPDRLEQVLTNLLSNAIKFSRPGGLVRLGARREAGTALLWVADAGRGIPADKLEAIFDRFQQVDASDSREKGGTGLGLAICRGIVDQHGGQIWAESRDGAGATFFCRLPALPDDPGRPEPTSPGGDAVRGER